MRRIALYILMVLSAMTFQNLFAQNTSLLINGGFENGETG